MADDDDRVRRTDSSDTPADERADESFRRELRAALAARPTPDAWVADALAIPRQLAPREERLLVTLLPQLAGGALLVGFAISMVMLRELPGSHPRPLPSLPSLPSLDFGSAGLAGLSPAIAAAVLLPALLGLGIVESVRGFPLLRRWFA